MPPHNLEAEAAVLAAGGRGLMVRTAAFFSPFDLHNFAHAVTAELAAGRPFQAASDLVVSPTYTPDLVDTVLDLLIDGETGLRHLANPGQVSWAEFARRIAVAVGLDANRVRAVPAATFGWAAPRPAFAALESLHGRLMPSLDDAISRYAHSLEPPSRPIPRAKPLELFDEPRSFVEFKSSTA